MWVYEDSFTCAYAACSAVSVDVYRTYAQPNTHTHKRTNIHSVTQTVHTCIIAHIHTQTEKIEKCYVCGRVCNRVYTNRSWKCMLEHTATHCSTLLHTATLQHTATRCICREYKIDIYLAARAIVYIHRYTCGIERYFESMCVLKDYTCTPSENTKTKIWHPWSRDCNSIYT